MDKALFETYVIYGLVDPRTGELRYVGQTRNPDKRRGAHRRARSGGLCGEWEAELKAAGLVPEFVVLEQDLTREQVNAAEKRWIIDLRVSGVLLLNMVEGAPGEPRLFPYPEEAKDRIAESMRRHWQDPAFRAEKTAKIKAAMAEPEWAEKHHAGVGHKLDDATKAKVSESVRALWEDPEYRASQGEAVRAGLEKTRANAESEAKRLATIRTEEHRAKIGEKSRQMWQNPESRAKLMEARRTQARPSEESKRKRIESLRRAYAEGRVSRKRQPRSEETERKRLESYKRTCAERKRRKAAGE